MFNSIEKHTIMVIDLQKAQHHWTYLFGHEDTIHEDIENAIVIFWFVHVNCECEAVRLSSFGL